MIANPTNRGGAGDVEQFAMANCLMLMSNQAAAAAQAAAGKPASADGEAAGKMFTCKTCGRKFSSFQALGGHRASHNKLKSSPACDGVTVPSPAKPKFHACSICGAEFATGQALGGHMRRHRSVIADRSGNSSVVTTEASVENSDGNTNSNDNEKKRKNDDVLSAEAPPMLKTSISKRVCLDLNLSFTEDDVKREEEHDVVAANHDDREIEEGEIVEDDHHEAKQVQEEVEHDFLKLELRPPIRDEKNN